VLEERGVADGVVALDPHMGSVRPETRGASLPGCRLCDAGDLLFEARAVKTDAEIALIDEGLSVAELAIEAGIEAVEVGVRECEVSGTIMDAMISAGAAGAYALPAIVSSGVRWSRCQEYPSESASVGESSSSSMKARCGRATTANWLEWRSPARRPTNSDRCIRRRLRPTRRRSMPSNPV